MLQHAQVPRADGRTDRRQRPHLRTALVARRDDRAARAVVQPRTAPLSRRLRAARPQIHYRLPLHAHPHDRISCRRRGAAKGAAVDTQAHAADDTLHAARRPLGDHAAPAPAARVPRQALSVESQHGGQRTLDGRAVRCQVPPLRGIPVALYADRPRRCRVRRRTRLVLRIRISGGAQTRLRGSRRSDDHRLLRVEDQEGRERDILSLDRHDGLGADDRRRVRSLAGTPNPQDRLSELPATLGTSVRHTSSGRAHGGHSRLPVVRPHRTRHVHVAARHNADAGLQGGLHGCTRYDDSRHARRRLRRLGLGDSLGRRTAVVLLDVAESRKTYRPEGAVVALRRGHEVRLGGLSPRHGRRRGGHARQRPDMGCGRQPTPDVDGDYGRRTSRHAARRIRRRDRGVVV